MIEVFISYAWLDNPPSYHSDDWEEPRGWVDSLRVVLGERLSMLRGERCEIWQDQDGHVRGNSELTPALREALKRSAALVVVGSPAYAASKWCAKEVEIFCEAWSNRGGLRVGSKVRLFKLDKLPFTPPTALAQAIDVQEVGGYPLHRVVDGAPLEYPPPHKFSGGDEFCRTVNALAWDIATVVDHKLDKAIRETIFLAHTAPDVANDRERLRVDLRQQGYTVLPLADYSEGPESEAKLREDVEESAIAIHVVGEDDPSAQQPVRSPASIEFAVTTAEVQRRDDFVRVVWSPPNAASPRTLRQVSHLERDLYVANADVSIEAVKDLVADQLQSARERREERESLPPPNDTKRVYLVFDPPDRVAASAVDDWLFKNHIEVLKPVSAPNAAARRKFHRTRLKASDGVLIYHGRASDDWLEANLDELRKVYAPKKNPNPRARGVMLADPETEYKTTFRAYVARVIKGFGRFDPGTLRDFLSDLGQEQ